MGRPIKAETITWWGCTALIIVAGVAPVVIMSIDSFWDNGQFTAGHYRALISTGRFWPLLGNSVSLALATTAFCGLLGVPIGVLFSKSDLPLRSLFMWVLTVPFVLPPYFMALGWTRLFARIGFASQGFFGFGGCALVLGSVFLPITILLTFASCINVDRRLEEAGRLVSSWPRVLRNITIPLSTPGVLFSLVIVFLLSIGEFSVPNFLRFPVLPVLSFTEFTASYNFGAATAAASPLAAIALFGALLETTFLKERVYAYRSAGDALRAPLHRWKSIFVFAIASISLVLVASPLAALLTDALSAAAIKEAIQRGGASVLRSVTYSAFAATILTGLGFLIGFFMRDRRLQILGPLTLGIFSIPGTVLSIGLVRLWNTPHTWFIYTTPALLMLGYAAQYSAVTARVAVSGLLLVPASFDEAAQLSGASWPGRLYRIWIPLSKRTLACAWLAGYILCLRDVPLALVTAPPGQDLLPGRILTLMANGSPSLIAALCLIMVLASLLPLIGLTRLIQPQGIAR